MKILNPQVTARTTTGLQKAQDIGASDTCSLRYAVYIYCMVTVKNVNLFKLLL